MERRRFQVGDVVRLNSGGPPATVCGVSTKTEEDGQEVGLLSVAWIVDGMMQEAAALDARAVQIVETVGEIEARVSRVHAARSAPRPAPPPNES